MKNGIMNLMHKPSLHFRMDDRETKELNGLISFEQPVKYFQTNKGIIAKYMALPQQILKQSRSKSQSNLKKHSAFTLKMRPVNIEKRSTSTKAEGHKRLNQSEMIYDLIKTRINNKLHKVRKLRLQLEEQVNNISKGIESPDILIRTHSKPMHIKRNTGTLPSIYKF